MVHSDSSPWFVLLLAALILFAPLGCGDDDQRDDESDAQLEADANDADARDEADSIDAEEEPEETGPGADITDCLVPITKEELRLTNEARQEAGLGELTCDLGLTRSATLHARDMCENDYFSHDSIDGRNLEDRVNETGVSWQMIGENIAAGQASALQVHEGWMNSPGHRENILTAGFGRIGIGYVRCDTGPYWVQNFAD